MKKFLKKSLRVIIYIHLFLFVALAFIQCSIIQDPRQTYSEAKNEEPYDVIIVPGVPYQYGSLSNIMKMRVFWAKHLYDNGYTKNIIFSGSSVYSPYVEGVVMKIMADSLGIPSDHTFAETKAEHSTENLYYSWKMAKELGFKNIALATDPFQNNMLKSFCEKYCDDVKTIPVVFGMMDFKSISLPKIDSRTAYVKDFISITKRENFWQRMKGTRGKRVIQEVEAAKRNETADIKSLKGAIGN